MFFLQGYIFVSHIVLGLSILILMLCLVSSLNKDLRKLQSPLFTNLCGGTFVKKHRERLFHKAQCVQLDPGNGPGAGEVDRH